MYKYVLSDNENNARDVRHFVPIMTLTSCDKESLSFWEAVMGEVVFKSIVKIQNKIALIQYFENIKYMLQKYFENIK